MALPQPGTSPTAGSGRGRGNKQDQIPFLKNDDLSTTPKQVKLLAVRFDPANKFGPSVIVKCSLDGQLRFWTVRLDNPNYQRLLDMFGTDENDWVSKTIWLRLEQDDFTEKFFPRVYSEQPKTKTATK